MGLTESELVGAVLVYGGGIAGIQSSLDLANSGYKVYLIEPNSSIGGNMALLDKTFPTGDCSTCILSPKLVEVARDLNIEILTLSEIMNIEGTAGDFTVKVKRHPRYIDGDRCTACSDCEEVCPVSLPDEFNRGLSERTAIFRTTPQAVPNIYTITKRERPPCQSSCPLGQNVQGYIALISTGKYDESLSLIREDNPLPSVCGYICHHPCEDACQRTMYDQPLSIRGLKRFAVEQSEADGIPIPEIEEERSERIAIVGAGPSGLSAGDTLRRKGYSIVIYDENDKAGGMLNSVIPDHRLPRQALSGDLTALEEMGIEFRMGFKVGEDITIDELKSSNDAVLLATGTPESVGLNIPGSQLSNIHPGLDFLRENVSGDGLKPGDNVVVIGGGNVAVDASRVAKHLGASKVSLYCLESPEEMPAFREEIEMAVKDGVEIYNRRGPVEFIGDKDVSGVRFARCTSVFDEEGNFAPVLDESDTISVKTDMVIVAIGQRIDESLSGENPEIEIEGGVYSVSSLDFQTGLESVFACGDMVNGPTTVIEALLSGRLAGKAVHAYLQGEEFNADTFIRENIGGKDVDWTDEKRDELNAVLERYEKIERAERELMPADGFSEETALSEANRCLNCGGCCECMECVKACEPDAIFHQMTEDEGTLNVGGVVLAGGFKPYDARLRGEYGFGRYENVLTNLQFERMLSSSGPTGGEIMRPSDDEHPGKIAFIQCVGSRDASIDHNYCSSVCCMATIKEAILAREHLPNVEVTVFHNDIRAFGKGFEDYYERAKTQYGVQFVRSNISRLYENPRTKNLSLVCISEKGELIEDEYDLIVLAVGMEPGDETTALMRMMGVEPDEFGFCDTNPTDTIATTREGVFVCGALEEPKDIPESVMQASASTSAVCELLSPVKHTLTEEKEYPPERDVIDELPRVGVFVCHCGINIGGVVDVPSVVEYAKEIPGVVYAEENLYTCSDDTQERMREIIDEHHLNRIVIASCTPRTHLALFQETARECGLNPGLVEMANIRDQCSWVHSTVEEDATEKAKILLRMAIARARELKALHTTEKPVVQSALVIGGGPAGMTAGLSLANQGYGVHIVERKAELGGMLSEIYSSLSGYSVGGLGRKLTARVDFHENITTHLNSEVVEVDGYIGNFRTTVREDGALKEIESGVIIIATGGEEAKTDEYLNGQNRRVMTNLALDEELHNNALDLSPDPQIVFIQCVGSREEERPYCSRICCGATVKNALHLLDRYPSARIIVLYRDIRIYGEREIYYEEARRRGVIFVRYDTDEKPVVTNEDGLTVNFREPGLGRHLEMKPDLVVLATGIDPAETGEDISDIMKLPTNEDGFFQEAHIKLRPVDFATEGIFLCGTAHSPKYLTENLTQARAVAGRAGAVLSRGFITVGGEVSVVDGDLCVACLTCQRVCPYSAPQLNHIGVMEIEPALCMGCGSCVAECPRSAIELNNYRSEQVRSMIGGFVK